MSELPLVGLRIHINPRCILFNRTLSMAPLKLVFQQDTEGPHNPMLRRSPTYASFSTKAGITYSSAHILKKHNAGIWSLMTTSHTVF